jgi:hypothetical protein
MTGCAIMAVAVGDMVRICGPREIILVALITVGKCQLIIASNMARDALLVGVCADERESRR